MGRNNKSVSKKRSFTFSLLYFWAKWTGVNPLNLSDNNQLRYSYYSMIYGIMLIVTYSYVWYRVLIERLNISYPGETPVAMIGTVMALAIDFLKVILTWLIYCFYQNRMKSIVKSFLKAEKTLSKLGIKVTYEKSFKKLAIYLLLTTATYISLMIFNNESTVFKEHIDTFLWMCYLLPQLTTITRTVIFIWILTNLKYKFQRLNDKVLFLMQNNCARMTRDNRGSSVLIVVSNCKPILLADKIQLIGQLHRELRDVIYRTVDHVALCVLLNILSQFLHITISVHVAYRFLKGRKQINLKDAAYSAALCPWLVIPIGTLALISNVCGSTSEEANKTGKILHNVLIDIDIFGETRDAVAFNVLSLDLLQNKFGISICGLFNLDYYLVYKAITTATTILTIMLQFYN